MLSWAKLIPLIIKFILTDLPLFIEQVQLASKDRQYNKAMDLYDDAIKNYKKTKSLDSLNQLGE